MAKYPRIRPSIPDPYPGAFDRVTDFHYQSRLELAREPDVLTMRRQAAVSYIVDADYTVSYRVDGDERTLTVPRGMLTDLSSAPWGTRNIVSQVGPHLEASIVHDFLYIAWQLIPGREARMNDFRFANAVLFAGLDRADVSPVSRAAIRLGLSLPGVSWKVYAERNDGPEDDGLFVDLDHPLPEEGRRAADMLHG